MSIPTIPTAEFAQRRAKLRAELGDNALAIIPAAGLTVRNADVEHRFRQNSTFRYFTHFPEPDAIAVISTVPDVPAYQLFCLPKNAKEEQWTGRRAGISGVTQNYQADAAYELADLTTTLLPQLKQCQQLYCDLGVNSALDSQLTDWLNQLRRQARDGIQSPVAIASLERIVHPMRLHKSPAEIACMRHAAQISAQAHCRAMQCARPGVFEYELEAEFDHEFRRHNMGTAYGSIVGGGDNACILHYVNNDQALNDGDLVLIDAGAEYQGYAADITRTFPVNGRFNAAQTAIYELVLKAQLAAIEKCTTEHCWNDPHDAAVHVLTTGLVELGLLQGDVATLIETGAYKTYYMHRTGHWLGLDVHDVGDYKVAGEWQRFAPGMVLTVEPGLYISPAENIDKQWWNIGVRIEDDVLITEHAPEVLTHAVPKTVAEVEAEMARG